MIVPIIMGLGFIIFCIGLFVYVRLGYQEIRTVTIRSKEYTLRRFTTMVIGSGILLIMLSIFIHKSVSYTANADTQNILSEVKSDFELELMFSDVGTGAMSAYIKQFQHEYQAAIIEKDSNTIGLLRMELAFRLREELGHQGYEATKLEQEVQRIIDRLPQ